MCRSVASCDVGVLHFHAAEELDENQPQVTNLDAGVAVFDRRPRTVVSRTTTSRGTTTTYGPPSEDDDICVCGHSGHVGPCEGTGATLDPMFGVPPDEKCVCDGTKFKITKPIDVSIVVAAATRDEALEFTENMWGSIERALEVAISGDGFKGGEIGDAAADAAYPDEDERFREISISGFLDDIEVESYA